MQVSNRRIPPNRGSSAGATRVRSGAAPPAAGQARCFQGSFPMASHEWGWPLDDTTREGSIRKFSYRTPPAPDYASWLGSLAALSAATRTRAPKCAIGSGNRPIEGRFPARLSSRLRNSPPVCCSRFRRPVGACENRSSFRASLSSAPKRKPHPNRMGFSFCACPQVLLSVNQCFLSCFSGDVAAPSSRSVTT